MTGYASDVSASSFDESGPPELAFDNAQATAGRAADLRHALADWLVTTPFGERERYDIVLAVYEAMANAVEHAYAHIGIDGTMSLQASFSEAEGLLQIEVSDRGRWREPTPSEIRGNGIPLMGSLSDNSSIGHTDSGTTVLMQWTVEF